MNHLARYQPGLTLGDIFPIQQGICACGCGKALTRGKRWFSVQCRDNAYIHFAILKGDTRVIRQELFKTDHGACRNCGEITSDWEADHIKPVFQGGGACDLSNFQTLCKSCHKEKSYANTTSQTLSKGHCRTP